MTYRKMNYFSSIRKLPSSRTSAFPRGMVKGLTGTSSDADL